MMRTARQRRTSRITRHLRWWGAAWLLAGLFTASILAQLVASLGDIHQEGFDYFWAEVFANWQSEWLQLFMQAVLLLAWKHALFKADAADMERIHEKLDNIEERLSERGWWR